MTTNALGLESSTLGEISQRKRTKKDKTYAKPKDGKVSAACDHGKCANCWMLGCGCKCHSNQRV